MPQFNPFTDCPGFAEAARRERELRDIPWLGLPENVGGVLCAPLTLRRVLWLQLTKTPFMAEIPAEALAQKPGIENDIVSFFWIVSEKFVPGSKRHQRRWEKKNGPAIMRMEVLKAVQEIKTYLDEAFMDASDGPGCDRSFYSNVAAIAVFFSKHFGLGIDAWENSWLRNLQRRLTGKPNPIDVPLRLYWQLQRAHINANNPMNWGNKISDKLLFGMHAEENLRLKREWEARENNRQN